MQYDQFIGQLFVHNDLVLGLCLCYNGIVKEWAYVSPLQYQKAGEYIAN